MYKEIRRIMLKAKDSTGKAKSTRVPFSMDADTHAALKQYSELLGVPMLLVMRRAVREFMDVQGKIEMEEAIARANRYGDSAKILTFPVPAAPLAEPALLALPAEPKQQN